MAKSIAAHLRVAMVADADADSFEAALNRLRRTIDKNLSQGGDAGVASLKRLQTSLDQTGYAAERANRDISNQFRNAGFQVQDFIVQVQSGQSAAVALGQQLPQLLQGFGALGVGLSVAAALFAPLVVSMIDFGVSAQESGDKINGVISTLDSFGTMAKKVGEDTAELANKFGLVTDEVLKLQNLAAELELEKAIVDARTIASDAGAIFGETFFDEIKEAFNVLLTGLSFELFDPASLDAATSDVFAIERSLALISEAGVDVKDSTMSIADNLAIMEDSGSTFQQQLDASKAVLAEITKLIDVASGGSEILGDRAAVVTTQLNQARKQALGLVEAFERVVRLSSLDLPGAIEGATAGTRQAEADKEAEKAARDLKRQQDAELRRIQSLANAQKSAIQRQIESIAELRAAHEKGLVTTQDVENAEKRLDELRTRASKRAAAPAVKQYNHLKSIAEQYYKQSLTAEQEFQHKMNEIRQAAAQFPQILDGDAVSRLEEELRRKRDKELNEDRDKAQERINTLTETLMTEHEKFQHELAKFEQDALTAGLSPEQTAEIRDKMIANFDEILAKKDPLIKMGEQIRDSFIDGFADMIVEGKDFKDVMNGILKDVAKQLIKLALTDVVGGRSGGLFSSIIGGLFGGFKADGGPVSGNTSYIVGERGPELFVPKSAGQIISNEDMVGGGQSGIFVNTIDARGADAGAVARIENALRTLNSSVENRAVSAVARAQQSTGRLRF